MSDLRDSFNEKKSEITVVTEDAAGTAKLGQELAKLLKAGDFLALDGSLAAGKTQLVKGLAQGLGYEGPVTSPTFAILQLYEGGRLDLYHFDVYRLEAAAELEELGYEDYFYGEGVACVEWSSLVLPYLPKERIEIQMTAVGQGDRRLIRLTFWGADQEEQANKSREYARSLAEFKAEENLC